MLYLVHVAPDLVGVPVPSRKNQIPFVWAFYTCISSSVSVDVLLQIGAPSGLIGAILEAMFGMFLFSSPGTNVLGEVLSYPWRRCRRRCHRWRRQFQDKVFCLLI